MTSARRKLFGSALFLACMMGMSCSRPPAGPTPSTQPASKHPTIASLVPAATDLIVGMGCRDHLLAISNYDIDRDETAGLPKVGDYQSIDWERLAALRPDVLVIFHSPGRLPAGLKQKADDLHIRLVNVKTDTLDELYAELSHLGQVLNEPEKAAVAVRDLQSRFERVAARVAGRPRVRTLIVRDETATGTVGPKTFLDDVLTIAGGTNVMTTPGWNEIDRETLTSLDPDAIVQLLSAVPPQVESNARQTWANLSSLPAVRNGRVHVINKWYTQQPGFHLPDLAEEMAEALHPTAGK